MADIFISYAREDREWVSHLANALQAEGYTVWWDWDLLVGKRYRETIETELQVCKATVVVWSQHSIKSDFVRDEAEEGQQRNILVPVLKESVRPPAGFRQLQTADLSTYTGGVTHAEFMRMMKGLSHLIGRPGLSAAEHVDAAPAPVEAPAAIEPPLPAQPVAEPVPAAPVLSAPMPVMQAKAPDPASAHTSVLGTSPPPAMTAKKGMPVIGYVAIGIVALVAIAFVAVALFPNNTPAPVKPLTPPVAHGGETPTGGPAPTGSHPTNPTNPTNPTPPGDTPGGDEAGNAHGSSSNSGGHNGGDTAPPAPPQPPADTNGADEGQSH